MAYPSNANRRGAIIVLFAILLPILIMVLGFTVDYAYMQRTRNEVRVVSDLASKAAADTLARTGSDEVAAAAAARLIASNNMVAGVNVTLRDSDIVFGRASRDASGVYSFQAGPKPSNAVQVSVRRDASTDEGPIASFFGKFYNSPTFDVAETSSAAFRDTEIILVLDRSGSMKFNLNAETLTVDEQMDIATKPPTPPSRWRSLDRAVEVFLAELESTPYPEQVAFVSFAESATLTHKGQTYTATQVTLDSTLNSDLSLIRSNMDRLNTSIWFGGTNITAGIRVARQHFESVPRPGVSRTIICLTDGKHNSGNVPTGEAALCNDAGIRVETITFSDEADQAGMIAAADAGGGRHYHAPDEASLKQIFRRLAASLAVLTE